MKSLDQILEKYNIKYCAVREGEVSHIILMLPYVPYTSYATNLVQIDAFYEASNLLYHLASQIRQEIVAEGYQVADSHIQLKPMAERGGLGTILANQLLCNSEYGTKTTLQSISVVGDFERKECMSVERICDNCGLCAKACPNGALDNGTFDRSLCLRHIQDYPNVINEHMGRRVLGCDQCQRCCPYNQKVGTRDIPEDIACLLDIDNMLDLICRGKKALKPFSDLYGYNYARPSVLARLIINTLVLNEDFSHTEAVAKLADHPSEEVRQIVRLYMTKLDK